MTRFTLSGVASYQGHSDGPYHQRFENLAGDVKGALSLDPAAPARVEGEVRLSFAPLAGGEKTQGFRESIGAHVPHLILLSPQALAGDALACRLSIGGGSWVEALTARLQRLELGPKRLELAGALEVPFAAFTESADEVSQAGQLVFGVGQVTVRFALEGRAPRAAKK